jgi:uncharacterized membrane protein YjfL (UPF0719 family)
MSPLDTLQSLLYLALGILLCAAGKAAHGAFNRRVEHDSQLVIKDNVAFAVPMAAYYFSILLCLGAAFSGPERGSLAKDLALTAGWGLASIVLLNLGAALARPWLFSGLSPEAEIVDRGNLAAGILAAGSYAASGLVTLGALSSHARLLPALALWGYGQALLTLSVRVLPLVLGYRTSPEIARGNRAVALAASGALVAVGNVLRLALTAAPPEASGAVAVVTGYALLGVALLPICSAAAQRLLWSGFTARHELLEQQHPNEGVGFLMCCFYVGASLLVGWVL